jgi:hypothetical protein
MANIGQRLLLLLVATLMVAAMAMLTAAPALPQDLTVPHEHELTVPGTGEDQQIAKGTGKCEANLRALNEVHSNVHLAFESESNLNPLRLSADTTDC